MAPALASHAPSVSAFASAGASAKDNGFKAAADAPTTSTAPLCNGTLRAAHVTFTDASLSHSTQNGTQRAEAEGTWERGSCKVKDKVKGKVKGEVSGDVDGKVDRKVDGKVSGDVDGKVNGKVSGDIDGDVDGHGGGDGVDPTAAPTSERRTSQRTRAQPSRAVGTKGRADASRAEASQRTKAPLSTAAVARLQAAYGHGASRPSFETSGNGFGFDLGIISSKALRRK
jgi:hypothetical protein